MSLKTWAAAAAISLSSATASFAAVIDLGFALDASGSVGSTSFSTMKNGLADALDNVVTTDGNEYRVSVVTFAESVTTILAPTIVTATNLSTIQNTIRAANWTQGLTYTDRAINTLLANFNGAAGGMSDISLFNISTDGAPLGRKPGGGFTSRQSETEQAAFNANLAGVDGISFEAIGRNLDATDRANMARIAGLGTSGNPANAVVITDPLLIPDPTQVGFVIDVLNFDAYGAAIDAKVQEVVNSTEVPLPAGLPLLLLGLGGMAMVRRKAA